jgi:hypothetical protein
MNKIIGYSSCIILSVMILVILAITVTGILDIFTFGDREIKEIRLSGIARIIAVGSLILVLPLRKLLYIAIGFTRGGLAEASIRNIQYSYFYLNETYRYQKLKQEIKVYILKLLT